MADQQRSPEFLRALARRKQHVEEARHDVNCFVEYCMTDNDGRPVKQAAIHREWQALGDRYRRLMILGSKQHGKSQQSLWRAMFKLGRDRNELIKIVCSSDRKGTKRMNTIRRNIEGNDGLHRVFPHLHPRSVRTINKKHLYLERPNDSPEPSVEAIGITSSATGDRATGLIVDDAVDQRNSVMQPKMRESIRNAWGDWYSLLSPAGWLFWISNLWHRCIPAGELVVTDEGRVPIHEYDGQRLRVAPGQFEKPTAFTRRWFEGELVELRLTGQPLPYRCTMNHRFPTTRGVLRADELALGDRLVLDVGVHPLSSDELAEKEPKEAPPRQDEPRPPTPERNTPSRVSREQLKQDLDDGLCYREIAEKYGYTNQGKPNPSHVIWLLKRYGLPRNRMRQVAREGWITNPRFWLLAGYWLAEGSYNPANGRARMVFGYSESETDLASDAAGCVSDSLGLKAIITPRDHNTLVSFNCQLVGEWLHATFGAGAPNKKIPDWIDRLPKELAREFIKGYWLGDGCLLKPNWAIRLNTSSIDLAHDLVRFLAAAFGASAQMYRRKEQVSEFCTGGPSYEVRVPLHYNEAIQLPTGRKAKLKRVHRMRVVDGRAEYPIKSIKRVKYSGWVYDVATSTGYFDLRGITSHNSDLTHELMANEAYAVARYEVDLETMEGIVTLPNGTVRRMPDGLWPEYWSVRKLKDQKRTLKPRAFARLYSLRPMSTTEVKVHRDWIKPWKSPPGKDWDRIMMLDLAESEEDAADMIGIAEAQVSKTSPKIKIVDAWHTKIDFDSKVTLLRDQHAEHHYSDIVLEKSAGGISLFQHLVRRRLPVRLLPVAGKPKGLWLDEAIPYLKAGVVEWDPWLIENTGEMGDRGDGVAELLNFGSYPTDNILDAITRLISYIVTCYEIFDDVNLDGDQDDGVPTVSRDYDDDDFEVILI